MATHCRIPAWKTPWTEEPGRLQFMGSPRDRQDLVTKPLPHMDKQGLFTRSNNHTIKCFYYLHPHRWFWKVFHRLLDFIIVSTALFIASLQWVRQSLAYSPCLFSERTAGYWLRPSLKSPGLRISDESLFDKAQCSNQVVSVILPLLLHKLHNDWDFCLASPLLYWPQGWE